MRKNGLLRAAKKIRADEALVIQGLVETKSRALALILSGTVYMDNTLISKAGTFVDPQKPLRLKEADHGYVSRGGVKLNGALMEFSFSPSGMECLDIGASTGGFTDCLLQHGASRVVAVDVGYGQLAEKLRTDLRVKNLERMNARDLTPEDIGCEVSLTVIDASFISLSKLIHSAFRCTKFGGFLLALIKPQFEVGKKVASKNRGVILDEKVRQAAIFETVATVTASGFSVLGVKDCVLPGPKGNVEAFVFAQKKSPLAPDLARP